MKRRQERRKYFAIVGKHTGQVIGVCTDLGVSDVTEEEPGSTLVRIPKSLFQQFNTPAFDTAFQSLPNKPSTR